METQQALMKHFASILKKRAGETKPMDNSIDPAIIKHLHRKDLIEIITEKHKGTLPVKLDLSILEKEELLPYIGDDLYIISHTVKKWCAELNNKTSATEEPKPPVVEDNKAEETTKETPPKDTKKRTP